MLDYLFRLSDGPIGNLFMVGGGLSAGVNGLIAQAHQAAALEGIPAYLNVAGIAGGLIIAATPLVLRVVDLQRLKTENRKKDHYIKGLQNAGRLKDLENRKLREFIVRSAQSHKFPLPEWFYGEDLGPVTPPGTGDHPLLIITPDPDAEPYSHDA